MVGGKWLVGNGDRRSGSTFGLVVHLMKRKYRAGGVGSSVRLVRLGQQVQQVVSAEKSVTKRLTDLGEKSVWSGQGWTRQ